MGDAKTLTAADCAAAASALSVPVATIKAVTSVESRGSGFLSDGVRPVILFERHVMRKQLIAHGNTADASHFEHTRPDIVNRAPGGYQGGAAEWDRLDAAVRIDRQSALESASWGLFQIMGYHWKALGYASVQDFVNAMYRSEGAQLDAFVRFIKVNPNLAIALRKRDWPTFAASYNGPAYKANHYDTKLAAAYQAAGGEVTA
ncbi:N-acetylmuramidase family protein [Burkholderia cenocepacia]|uniref:N-acetylmuramidase family protein n=1 Tax=Burkholderia cenocepacia TaxID=95486 RepID=UPI002AB6D2B9|nr:N-acetylmuramidase family protein [Burkholderia cenocepacia]